MTPVEQMVESLPWLQRVPVVVKACGCRYENVTYRGRTRKELREKIKADRGRCCINCMDPQQMKKFHIQGSGHSYRIEEGYHTAI